MTNNTRGAVRVRPNRGTVAVALASGCFVVTATAALGDDAKLANYGRHLARECTTCHRIDGVDNGIPSIVGWPPDTFIATMNFYRDGARNNPVMVSVANSLSDEQLRALATFFASVPRSANKEPGSKRSGKSEQAR